MKKDYTEIGVVLDSSGSMGYLRDDAIGGYNTFIEEQKKLPGEAKVSLYTFNSMTSEVCDGEPIEKIKPLCEQTYKTQGMTALYDCVGLMIDNMGKRFDAMNEDEKPEHVIIAILTDGQENSSREYTQMQISDKIKHQREKYSWEFIFLAANQDAFEAGLNLSIPASATMNFSADACGLQTAYKSINIYTTSLRTGKSPSYIVQDTQG